MDKKNHIAFKELEEAIKPARTQVLKTTYIPKRISKAFSVTVDTNSGRYIVTKKKHPKPNAVHRKG